NQVKNAEWNNLNEIIHQFSNVSLLKNNRVVFNIKGNKYRLIVWVELERKHVFVKFIGTHVDYDKIDANKI
ncbi:MAG: type II toxin-antitoxin system HigB family toxin, partial [Chitinophagales bacterium]|nr:type II toxin-antitoxin system HigB family toxin [Chitinophagales bacterium]